MLSTAVMKKVKSVQAREVLDSRGFPTVEVELTLESSTGETFTGRAMVPSGASTGEGEALELRDGDSGRYLGKGVTKAVKNIQATIAPFLVNREFSSQSILDDALCNLDGTSNKSQLGANAILGVSMAFTKAQALSQKVSPDQLIASNFDTVTVPHGGLQAAPNGGFHAVPEGSFHTVPKGSLLPVPMMNILNGGKHADNGLAIQEFMIVPAGFNKFSEALRAGVEVFHRLKKILHQKGLATGVGDEGGFAPVFPGDKPHEQALTVVTQAISEAGYKPGVNIFLAVDAAASEFSQGKNTYQFEGKTLSSKEMIAVYEHWIQKFPIISIEDGLAEHDWEGWKALTVALGDRCQLVGDDLFVTNPVFFKKGIEQKAANAILIKLNQIGTVNETLQTMKLAEHSNYRSIVSQT